MTIEPVSASIHIDTEAQRAFELFTTGIGEWWPFETYAVLEGGTVAFEGDDLVERAGDASAVWGEVIQWEPPLALAFTWHPGNGVDVATDIRVTFEGEDARTLVTLTHSSWERASDPEAARARYADAWPAVLERYAAHVAAQA